MSETTDSTHFNYFQLMDMKWTGFPVGAITYYLASFFLKLYENEKQLD